MREGAPRDGLCKPVSRLCGLQGLPASAPGAERSGRASCLSMTRCRAVGIVRRERAEDVLVGRKASERCPRTTHCWSVRAELPRSKMRFGVSYLVDPASSHMLVPKIKPCMSKYKQVNT